MFAVYIPQLIQSWFPARRESTRKERAQTEKEEELDEFGDPVGVDMTDGDASFDPSILHRFESASNFLPSIMGRLQKQDLMQFYGLYKQATAGPANPSERPSMLDLKARAKFDAWADLGEMPKQVAMLTYAAKMDYMGLGWDYTQPSTQGYGMRPSRPAASTSESSDDLMVQDKETTLWFAAAKADDVTTMKKICGRRPELVLERDQHLGMTALHWAIDSGCDAVVRFLLENGAGVNETDPEGNTPLHFAACCHRRAAAELLLSRGADRALTNTEGLTAADSCVDEPNLHALLSAQE